MHDAFVRLTVGTGAMNQGGALRCGEGLRTFGIANFER